MGVISNVYYTTYNYLMYGGGVEVPDFEQFQELVDDDDNFEVIPMDSTVGQERVEPKTSHGEQQAPLMDGFTDAVESEAKKKKKKKKKKPSSAATNAESSTDEKVPPTRGKTVKLSKLEAVDDDSIEEDISHYPGIINISGTFCFLNSVVQAFASLPTLIQSLRPVPVPSVSPFLSSITLSAPPPSLTQSLLSILSSLTKPSTYTPSPLRPSTLIHALSHTPSAKRLFNTREHQDAQELFTLLLGGLEDEDKALFKVPSEGLKELLRENMSQGPVRWKNPFEGRMVYRRCCLKCNYSEGIRLNQVGGLQLTLPTASHCTLAELFNDLTKIEDLETECRRCSLIATLKTTKMDLDALQAAPVEPIFISVEDKGEKLDEAKMKRREEKRRVKIQQAQAAFDEVKTKVLSKRYEEPLSSTIIQTKITTPQTRQDMLGTPPPVLALHLQRSTFSMTTGREGKNLCRVMFPEWIDWEDWAVNGFINVLNGKHPISLPPVKESILERLDKIRKEAKESVERGLSSLPTPPSSPPPESQQLEAETQQPEEIKTMYRLASVIYHYGTQDYGHYITFRRISDTRWLRISDDEVQHVTLGQVLNDRGSAFMIFYEKHLSSQSQPALMTALKNRGIVTSCSLGVRD